jgi:hypothetical protein
MKRFFLVLVAVLVLAAGSISGQESESGAENWLSAELGLLGVGARYERMLGPKFSIGLDVYWNSAFLYWNEFEAGIFGRFYPWEGTFFWELGLGFHNHTALSFFKGIVVINGAAVSPGLGWKIDVGKPGEFFITPGIKVPVTVGIDQFANLFDVGIGVVPYFGLGGAF